jgi:hypothetical protein
MLTEYALTPYLFDDQHNSDDPEWLERLRAFGERLLPTDSGRMSNTVVSDLCDGSWYATGFLPLLQDLERRRNEDHTTLTALALLKTLRPRLEGCLVKRPFCDDLLPDSEEQWACEAETSSARSRLPIHRIVGSHRLAPGPQRHTLPQTQEETFWDTVPVTQTIPADMGQQLAAVQRMCSLYSFLAFASPQLSALGSGKDLNFAIEFARAALRRPRDFPPPQRIDLHAEGTTDGEAQRAQQAEAILRRVEADLGPATSLVRVLLWRTVKERRLLVGHSDSSDGHPRVLWAVAMTHVARPDTDSPARDRHTFSVLDRRETSRLSSELYSDTARQLYPGSPWTVKSGARHG